jgi:hypothetical protein
VGKGFLLLPIVLFIVLLTLNYLLGLLIVSFGFWGLGMLGWVMFGSFFATGTLFGG